MYQNHVNAIPYVDAQTGQKTVLMPVFPELTEFEIELEKKNIASFEALGYRVVTVPTKTDEIMGGIHCLTNVLG